MASKAGAHHRRFGATTTLNGLRTVVRAGVPRGLDQLRAEVDQARAETEEVEAEQANSKANSQHEEAIERLDHLPVEENEELVGLFRRAQGQLVDPTLNRRIDALEGLLGTANEEKAALRKEKEGVAEELRASKDTVSSLRQEMEGLAREKETLVKEREGLAKHLQESGDTVAALREEQSAWKGDRADLEGNLERSETLARDLRTELEKVNDELRESKDTVVSVEGEKKTLSTKIAELEGALQRSKKAQTAAEKARSAAEISALDERVKWKRLVDTSTRGLFARLDSARGSFARMACRLFQCQIRMKRARRWLQNAMKDSAVSWRVYLLLKERLESLDPDLLPGVMPPQEDNEGEGSDQSDWETIVE